MSRSFTAPIAAATWCMRRWPGTSRRSRTTTMTEHPDREVLRALAETLDAAETCARLGLSRAELRQCLERAAEAPAYEILPAPETGGALTLNIDGAARGNPGPAGAGV